MTKYLKSLMGSVLFIVSFSPQFIRAQWITYNTANTTPISGAFITDISESSNKNLWFGCEKGLWCFNSKYNTWQSYSSYITGTLVSDIQILENEVWVGTEGMGVFHISGTNKTFYNSKNGLCGNVIKAVTSDKSGNIWAASYGSGISKISAGNITNYTTATGLPTNLFLSAFCDSKGNLWFGTSNKGLLKFDGTNKTLYTKSNGLASNSVLKIFEDSKGKLWVCGSSGISVYDGITWKKFGVSEGLIDSSAYCVLEQPDGRIYIGTAGGITIINGNDVSSITTYAGLISDQVYCMLNSSDGTFWIGHMDKGLVKYQDNKWIEVSKTKALGTSSFYTAIEAPNGKMWFGAYGIYEFDGENWTSINSNNGLYISNVYSLFRDDQSYIYAVGYSTYNNTKKSLAVYNNENWSTINIPTLLTSTYSIEIKDFIIDHEGTYWLATATKGLWARKEGIWYYMLTSTSSPINRLYEDSKGMVWACAYDALYRFKNGKSYDFFKTHNGLPTIKVNDITEDKNGNIWVVCGYDYLSKQNGGLAVYDGHNWIVYQNELHTIDPVSVFCDHEGSIWVGGAPRQAGDKTCVSILKDAEWSYYNTDSGIASTNIRRFYEDSHQNMWLCTSNGISMHPASVPNSIKRPVFTILNTYPNPSENYVMLKGKVNAETKLHINLTNLMGGICYEEYFQPDYYGKFSIEIPVLNLTNGVYLCSIRCKDEIITKKIIVQH